MAMYTFKGIVYEIGRLEVNPYYPEKKSIEFKFVPEGQLHRTHRCEAYGKNAERIARNVRDYEMVEFRATYGLCDNSYESLEDVELIRRYSQTCQETPLRVLLDQGWEISEPNEFHSMYRALYRREDGAYGWFDFEDEDDIVPALEGITGDPANAAWCWLKVIDPVINDDLRLFWIKRQRLVYRLHYEMFKHHFSYNPYEWSNDKPEDAYKWWTVLRKVDEEALEMIHKEMAVRATECEVATA